MMPKQSDLYPPTKSHIFAFFEQKISKTAIQERDDEFVIVGKFCIVALEPEGVIDVWICNPKNLGALHPPPSNACRDGHPTPQGEGR